jgi:hypothetical protein
VNIDRSRGVVDGFQDGRRQKSVEYLDEIIGAAEPTLSRMVRSAPNKRAIGSEVRNRKKRRVERLAKLTWRARGTGGTCTAEVDHPIRGYRINQRNRSNPFVTPGPDGATPTVTWISFDGDTYWVRLSAAQGWPRTIRVTQGDVDGARLSKTQTDDLE